MILRSCASVFVLLRGDTLATREGGVKGNTPQVSLLPLVSAAGTPPFSTAHFHSLPQNRLKERRGREGGRGGEGGRASRGRGERAPDKKVKIGWQPLQTAEKSMPSPQNRWATNGHHRKPGGHPLKTGEKPVAASLRSANVRRIISRSRVS